MSRQPKVMLNASTPAVPSWAPMVFDGIATLRGDTLAMSVTASSIAELLGSTHSAAGQQEIAAQVLRLCKMFAPKPVWYRTMDPDGDFSLSPDGPTEPHGTCPSPLRGLGMSLSCPELLRFELEIVLGARRNGASNLGIKFPMVTHGDQLLRVQNVLCDMEASADFSPPLGVTIETPRAALCSEEFVKHGATFATVGVQDLGCLALGYSREYGNGGLTDFFEDQAIRLLIEHACRPFRAAGLECIISGIGSPSRAALHCGASFGTGVAIAHADANAVEEARRIMKELIGE